MRRVQRCSASFFCGETSFARVRLPTETHQPNGFTERYSDTSVGVEVGGATVSVAVGGWVEVGVSLGTGVSVTVGVSVSRMKGVILCVSVKTGVKLGVWLGGTNPVFVIVGVCVMVGDSGEVSGVRTCGVSDGGMLVGDCVGVNRLGACRSAVNPAQ